MAIQYIIINFLISEPKTVRILIRTCNQLSFEHTQHMFRLMPSFMVHFVCYESIQYSVFLLQIYALGTLNETLLMRAHNKVCAKIRKQIAVLMEKDQRSATSLLLLLFFFFGGGEQKVTLIMFYYARKKPYTSCILSKD